jgi:hypothetical protein
MKYLNVTVRATVDSRAKVGLNLVHPGDAVLIVRGYPRWLLLKCPCGCGEEIPVNLDQRAGKAWRIYGSKEQGVTLFPSIWRDTGCQSHFIVWGGRILLFGGWEREDAISPHRPGQDILEQDIRAAWPNREWINYVDLADALDQIPWDVLAACRRLTKSGFLIEGLGDQQAHFRLS